MTKKPTTIDKFKDLQLRADKVRNEAKQEALAKAKEALAELKDLGFTFQLIEHKETALGKGTVAAGPCSLCKFETTPPHDGRAHRSQGDEKVPFTRAQLKKLGLQKLV
jgi:hypothetical protein